MRSGISFDKTKGTVPPSLEPVIMSSTLPDRPRVMAGTVSRCPRWGASQR
jgi:hypothetical protein